MPFLGPDFSAAPKTGATLRELMDRMGHASTRAALIYLHAWEERDQAIAEGIDAMVRKAARKAKKKARKKKGHAGGTVPGKGAT
ncbi:MAG TPA: hypothetical protein VGD71_16735 [Kribbella sp.]